MIGFSHCASHSLWILAYRVLFNQQTFIYYDVFVVKLYRMDCIGGKETIVWSVAAMVVAGEINANLLISLPEERKHTMAFY